MPSNIKDALKATPLVGDVGRTMMGVLRDSRQALSNWWQHGIVIPALIDVRMTWDEYQDALSQKAAYNLRTSEALNSDCEYKIIEGFDRQLVQRFISLWNLSYHTPPDLLATLTRTHENGWLRIRAARLNDAYISIHLIEQYDRYALCHAPWFDRTAMKERSLGTHMWFRLIQQATQDPSIDFLDIGGGPVSSLPSEHYKRRYSPRDLGFRVKACFRCGYLKMFRDIQEIMTCGNCGASVGLWRYVARLRS